MVFNKKAAKKHSCPKNPGGPRRTNLQGIVNTGRKQGSVLRWEDGSLRVRTANGEGHLALMIKWHIVND